MPRTSSLLSVDDHALDLAPVAEVRDVADVAAALGARGRFKAGVVAVAFDQLGGIGQRDAAMDEGAIHAGDHSPRPLRDCRQTSSTAC